MANENNNTETTIPESQREESLKQFWGAIKKFFGDLSTLDVVTMSGTINLTVNQIKGFQDILGSLAGGNNNLHTVAVSHHEIDYDAALFVKDNLTESEKELLQMHMETVKTAQEMRNKVVELATNALGLK